MVYIFMTLMAAVMVAADQLTKLWIVSHQAQLPIGVLDGIFHLTYTENRGAAFSSFQGMQWLFLIIFIAFTVGIIWEFSKKRMPFTTFDRWCIVVIYAGGLGNMIDRLRLGYVVDMIQVEFINFPVFNVADCFITCGCVLLIAHLVLFNKDFWKDDKKK